MNNNQPDKTENIDGALVQHGNYNHRIYLMNIGTAHPDRLASQLIALAKERGYSKIFAKVPSSKSSPFIEQGFRVEARIPLFYSGQEEAQFLGYYLNDKRKLEPHNQRYNNILKLAKIKQKEFKAKPLPRDYVIRPCVPSDIEAMAEIYRTVFPTYPFPIHDPAYLHDTMKTHVMYFGIETKGQLVALSSAETDQKSQNAEMTDFATLDKWRGHNLAYHLLKEMEHCMISKNIPVTYTIARAESAGMNITFARLGYLFGGRLINNTNIAGHIESMNVWYKKI